MIKKSDLYPLATASGVSFSETPSGIVLADGDIRVGVMCLQDRDLWSVEVACEWVKYPRAAEALAAAVAEVKRRVVSRNTPSYHPPFQYTRENWS